MAYRTCTSCYRELEGDDAFCRRCFRKQNPVARVVVLLGVAGAPLLVAGMLTFNSRLSLVGGLIAAAAVVLHIVIVAR
jgi:predicted amidophosphoribosyltransferase